MLYVILFFAPDILADNRSMMREIVDKHFSDNWIVPVYVAIALVASRVPTARARRTQVHGATRGPVGGVGAVRAAPRALGCAPVWCVT